MQLIADNLACARGARTILGGLSFTLAAGEALVLVGPNGAGKTTLIRTIAGFLPLAGGSLRLDGGDADRAIGQQSHYIGHLNAVKAGLTVRENAGFWAEFFGSADAGVAEVLRRVGLAALADIPAAYLSAGQKRRLGLARLLLARRPLWLLDEPTVSLDADGQRLLADVTNEHLASGGLVLAATHVPLGLASARELRLGPPVAA